MSLFHTCFKCTDKDWDDIKFGVDNQVDYYAVSFVKDAQVVHELKDYLRSNLQSNFVKNHIMHLFDNLLSSFYSILFSGCNADIHVIVKIESADSIPNLHSIITASDGVKKYLTLIMLWSSEMPSKGLSLHEWSLSCMGNHES